MTTMNDTSGLSNIMLDSNDALDLTNLRTNVQRVWSGVDRDYYSSYCEWSRARNCDQYASPQQVASGATNKSPELVDHLFVVSCDSGKQIQLGDSMIAVDSQGQQHFLKVEPISFPTGAFRERINVNQRTSLRRRSAPKRQKTPEQLEMLERSFEKCPYVDKEQRIQLSKQIGLTDSQIRLWFQYRRYRMSQRREQGSVSQQSAETQV